MISKSQTRNAHLGRVRPSFTLVELLIAITIIGIMLGMVLYTLAGARQDAMTARTKGTIKKLNDIMLARWEEFRYRAVKINIPEEWLLPPPFASGTIPSILSPREGARLRMVILRDIMRMEFPDRYSDILYAPTFYKTALYTSDNLAPTLNTSNDVAQFLDRTIPAAYRSFRSKMVSAGGTMQDPYPRASGIGPFGLLIPTMEHQNAELLYQIIASSNLNGANGLEFFRASEIGDVDNDGFPEFIDAWGRPINWLRWPAGYGVVVSSMSADNIAKSRPVDASVNDRTIPDPMDPLRTDWRWNHTGFANLSKPWMLVPLIVSSGPDGYFDIQFDASVDYATHEWNLGGTSSSVYGTYSFPDPYVNYYKTSGTPITEAQGGLGQWQDDDGSPNTFGAQDNVTNYSLILE